ncbi:MAG: RdgB/HAM1 family non-canonical purine NTP pyrophosphatase [Candidatus Aenigmatarchaeota archaeon]
MKKLYFISNNEEKIKEVSSFFKNFGIKIIGKKLNLLEPKYKRLEEVAREKAIQASKKLKKPLIVEDTGIYFNCYKNFPGTISKFIFETIGFDGIFRLLSRKTRRAYFKTAVAYYKPREKILIFTGICRGKITRKIRGRINKKMPYDNIFVPEGCKKTFSEMSKEEKAKYSHRAKALEKFAKWFIKN